jgi:integrase/recombinase XerC
MDMSAAWEAAIRGWLDHAQGLDPAPAATTLRTRREHLQRAGRCLGGDPWRITGPQLVSWFEAQPWATETRRGHRATHRAFWGWAVEAGHVEVSPARGLPRIQPSPPRPKPTPDRAYSIALAAASPLHRLMVRLSAEVGMRRAEVAQAHTRDLVEDLEGWSLLVHGKGGRTRLVPLPRALAVELRRQPEGYLFPGSDNGHLSPRWVGKVVGRLLPDGYTMHCNRHRFATRTHQAENDLVVVQELLGHANINTTRAYVAVDRSKLRRAVETAAA